MIILKSVDSTNAYVKREWASLPDGGGVLAYEQISGRGRLGRSWRSELGGLYLSVYLRENPGMLPFRAALAVRDALPPETDARFKWPNDLLLLSSGRYKKLCGILCEGFEGGCVVGIGVNLRFASEPPTPNAVCLADFCEPPAPEALAETICERLRERSRTDPSEVLRAYEPLCATLGREVTLPDGRAGLAVGLSSDGCLLVRTADGEARVGSGEVVVQSIY